MHNFAMWCSAKELDLMRIWLFIASNCVINVSCKFSCELARFLRYQIELNGLLNA